MSDEAYEKQFVKEAFNSNWIAALGPMVDAMNKRLSNTQILFTQSR
jgi:hypothetical protein